MLPAAARSRRSSVADSFGAFDGSTGVSPACADLAHSSWPSTEWCRALAGAARGRRAPRAGVADRPDQGPDRPRTATAAALRYAEVAPDHRLGLRPHRRAAQRSSATSRCGGDAVRPGLFEFFHTDDSLYDASRGRHGAPRPRAAGQRRRRHPFHRHARGLTSGSDPRSAERRLRIRAPCTPTTTRARVSDRAPRAAGALEQLVDVSHPIVRAHPLDRRAGALLRPATGHARRGHAGSGGARAAPVAAGSRRAERPALRARLATARRPDLGQRLGPTLREQRFSGRRATPLLALHGRGPKPSRLSSVGRPGTVGTSGTSRAAPTTGGPPRSRRRRRTPGR